MMCLSLVLGKVWILIVGHGGGKMSFNRLELWKTLPQLFLCQQNNNLHSVLNKTVWECEQNEILYCSKKFTVNKVSCCLLSKNWEFTTYRWIQMMILHMGFKSIGKEWKWNRTIIQQRRGHTPPENWDRRAMPPEKRHNCSRLFSQVQVRLVDV